MSQNFRTEKDLLGSAEIPADALYGIHTQRATFNFNSLGQKISEELIRAYGDVKLACLRVNQKLGFFLEKNYFTAMEQACLELSQGVLIEHIIVDALQGGAGTSTNMNVNEVLANRALQLLGEKPGSYHLISPLGHINLHQSTNDTYPTALKIAAIRKIKKLEIELVALQESFQKKEVEFAEIVKVGRTEMQDAVLITLGREMGAYAEAINRDRWRVYKCEERLRVVNLGGTAIGTGCGAPRAFIFQATEELRQITGLNLCRAENLVECTQNADVFAEVSGILKTCATNLLKISNDLRLLSSGPVGGFYEICLPSRQAGSSIMPGKVNPVIPEAAAEAAMMTMGLDSVISHAVSSGSLELNPFLPLIAHSLFTQCDLLTHSICKLRTLCVDGISANLISCQKSVISSTAIITALVGKVGYERAQEIASASSAEGKAIKQYVIEQKILSEQDFELLISPESVCKLGT